MKVTKKEVQQKIPNWLGMESKIYWILRQK